MSTHRRKVSDSDRGSAPSAPDELEVPRSCGISIPGGGLPGRAAVGSTIGGDTIDSGERGVFVRGVPDQHSRNSTSHKGQREIVNSQS